MQLNEPMDIAAVAATARRLVEQVDRVIVGKDAVVELLLVAPSAGFSLRPTCCPLTSPV